MKKLSNLKRSVGLVSLVSAVIMSLAVPQITLAAEAIMLSPSRVEELVAPGQVITKSITVTNSSESPKKIYAYLRDFTAEGEEGKPRLIVPGTEQGSFLSSWISVTSEGVDIPAGSSADFPYTVTVPQNAGPGGYYGAIIFGTRAPDVKIDSAEKGAAIGVAQQAGSLILLQIPGDANETASVRDFVTDKEFYSTPFKVNFTTRLQNQGNVHVKPRGTIEIANMLGNKVANVRINDTGANILPNSTRRFEVPWSGDFGFGKYKAQLVLTYGTSAEQGGNGMQSLTSIKYFWIFPWKIIGIVVSGIAFLIAAIFIFLKVYKNKAIESAMSEMGVGSEYYVKKTQGGSPAMHLGLTLAILLAVVFLLAAVTYFLFFA
ncbi:hypothetical protein HGA34_02555 [Candidatus Falkowbacteria bacterium]|nr:hypothetical protein [Candidatus Falkowbacteria bacterium]